MTAPSSSSPFIIEVTPVVVEDNSDRGSEVPLPRIQSISELKLFEQVVFGRTFLPGYWIAPYDGHA